MADHAHLHVLCAYGVPASLSERLMNEYKEEDEIPLSELDSTQHHVQD